MDQTTIGYAAKQPLQKTIVVPAWERISLLFVLGYEAAGCLLGGSLLVTKPDGSLMDMPADIMHGVFADFLVPGIILFCLGILNAIAFIVVLRRSRAGWVMASLAIGGLLIWFGVEIAILRELHWLHIMWGFPVYYGAIATVALIGSRFGAVRRTLLVCGIAASVLYVLLNIFIPMQWAAYHSASQTVSELSALGAPTRALWIWLSIPYTLLMIAFAWGVLKSANGNRPLRIAGILLLVYGALGIFWPLAPMHLRETLAAGGATWTDTIHLTLGAVTEVIYLLALGFAAAALGRSFRIYSIITFIILLIFGALTFMDAPGVSANEPTPFIGLWERINIGVFLVWVIVLALKLMSRQPQTETRA